MWLADELLADLEEENGNINEDVDEPMETDQF